MVLAVGALALAGAQQPRDPAASAEAQLHRLVGDGADAHLRAALAGVQPVELRSFVARRIDERLRALRAANFRVGVGDVERTVIDFEVWRAATYLSAGVFPKRYFGYLDERGDTQLFESTLHQVLVGARPLVDAAQAQRHSAVRAADLEIAVTFLAEGGATLLSDEAHARTPVAAISGVGLDDIAGGFAARRDLVAAFDQRFGTHLVDFVGRRPSRPLTFVEAVLAVEIMYVWEKDLLAAKLPAPPLMSRPLDEQFIVSSLRYNSGVMFSAERVEMIRTFGAGPYLYDLSERSSATRPRLPLAPPGDALSRLVADGHYPEQRTSWSAVYHILQRWGAFYALRHFTDRFDSDGIYF